MANKYMEPSTYFKMLGVKYSRGKVELNGRGENAYSAKECGWSDD